MSCSRCGRQTPRSRLCKQCALDQRYSTGPVGGTGSDEEEEADDE
jgi:predicted amidophosphoribosyltransferase